VSRYVTETRLELVPHNLNIKKSSRNTARLFDWCALGSPGGPGATQTVDVLERGHEFAFGLEPDDQQLG